MFWFSLGFFVDCAALFQCNKVVIWGHKLHTHTHSYVHYAFYRSFKYLGYDTLWLDNDDNINNIDFSGSLFVTTGLADKKIPLRDDCYYVLHNCDLQKYHDLYQKGRCLILQVYTHDLLSRDVEKIEDYIYFQKSNKTLYMPWATDLLPQEIDVIKVSMPHNKENYCYWVGTICPDEPFSNHKQLYRFIKACKENGIRFIHKQSISPEQNREHIIRSIVAPAIQGKWQCEKGYIPCRIFKNISYGALGVTNSKTVYELFKGKIVYHEDPYQLCYLALERSKSITLGELHELMDFVKEKHTYVNRIEHILHALTLIEQ
ncbi:hypothetical protein KJZ61_04375 [Candidatus Dependentiae bacterium]|nr:hypothetical protein [Candidatus Dependentiae bacterium]